MGCIKNFSSVKVIFQLIFTIFVFIFLVMWSAWLLLWNLDRYYLLHVKAPTGKVSFRNQVKIDSFLVVCLFRTLVSTVTLVFTTSTASLLLILIEKNWFDFLLFPSLSHLHLDLGQHALVSPFAVRMKIRLTLKPDSVRNEYFHLTKPVIKFLNENNELKVFKNLPFLSVKNIILGTTKLKFI